MQTNKKRKQSQQNSPETTPNKKQKVENISIHNLYFSDYTKYGIKSLAFNKTQSLLAVGRMNGEIEIWYTDSDDYNEWVAIKVHNVVVDSPYKKIPAKKNTTVESILWIGETGNERLFTAGLHGYITEWDLEKCIPKATSDSYGGAIWCLATNQNEDLIAAACQSGRAVLFDTELRLKKTFGPPITDKIPAIPALSHCVGTRLQAVTFTPDGERIIVGGFTGIYCYDLKTFEMKYRIEIDSGIVWCLKYLKDDTLVAGDSSGRTIFCDGEFGTVSASFKQHVADVLSLATNADEDCVYSTGVDAKICLFQKKKEGQWVYSTGKRPHHNDIHAIALYKDSVVVSGSVDTRLALTTLKSFHTHMRKIFVYYYNAPVKNIVHYASKQRLVLVNDNNRSLKLLYLPKTSVEDDLNSLKHGTKLDFKEPPSMLLTIHTKSKGGWDISDANISPDGKWIAYTAVDTTILFEINFDSQLIHARVQQQFDLTQNGIVPGHHLAFSSDSKKLFIVSRDNKIQVVDVVSQKLLNTLDTDTSDLEETTIDGTTSSKVAQYIPNTVTAIASNGDWLAVSYNTSINIYSLKDKSNLVWWSVNLQAGIIYKLSFYNEDCFSVISTGNTVAMFNAKTKSAILKTGIVSFSSYLQYPLLYTFPVGDDKLILGNSRHIYNADTKGKVNWIQKVNDKGRTSILGLLPIAEKEAILLQIPYDTIEMRLPDVCYRHRFGT